MGSASLPVSRGGGDARVTCGVCAIQLCLLGLSHLLLAPTLRESWHGQEAVLILKSTHQKARTFKWFVLKKGLKRHCIPGHIPCLELLKITLKNLEMKHAMLVSLIKTIKYSNQTRALQQAWYDGRQCLDRRKDAHLSEAEKARTHILALLINSTEAGNLLRDRKSKF